MAIPGKIPSSPIRPEKPPTPPPKEEKKSIFGEIGYVKSSIFEKEFKKDEYFSKLKGIPQKERIEIGKMLGNREVFGDLIERGESWKVQSLERALREGYSSDPNINKIAKTIREKYGKEKAKILAEIIHEKFFEKK